MTFAGGKLMLVYYDLRETRAKSFDQFIDDKTAFNDPQGTGLRHTIDIRASMATPGAPPVFAPSVQVSDYLEGPMTPGGPNGRCRSTRRTCRCSSRARCRSSATTSTSPRRRR